MFRLGMNLEFAVRNRSRESAFDAALPDHEPAIPVEHDTREARRARVPYIEVPDESRAHGTNASRGDPILASDLPGGSNSLHDDRRSIPLAAFEPLLKVRSAKFVSLQKGAGAEQADAWRGKIEDWMDGCDDFIDTAALVSNLDLVIASTPRWYILRARWASRCGCSNRTGSDWRWGLESEHSAWYPSMRIFRQSDALSWRHVIDQVSAAFIDFVPAKATDS